MGRWVLDECLSNRHFPLIRSVQTSNQYRIETMRANGSSAHDRELSMNG